MEFLIINGEILRKEEANFTSFFWGRPLPLLRKMWFGYGGIPLFNENIQALLEQLKELGATAPDLLKNTRELFRITKRMLNKNKFYRSGWINFQLLITKTAVNYVVTCDAVEVFDFPLLSQGAMAHFSRTKKNSGAPFRQFSFVNQAIWMAEEAASSRGQFQNTFFLNENGAVCDAISANVYLMKDKTLITPAIETGCVEDTLRNPILTIAAELKFTVIQTENLSPDKVLEMDEIFTVGEERGIEWVLGMENKRFVKKTVLVFHRKLNEFLKEKTH